MAHSAPTRPICCATRCKSGKRVRNETLANLSHLPPELIEALRAGLAGKQLLVRVRGLEFMRALPHGLVAAQGDFRWCPSTPPKGYFASSVLRDRRSHFGPVAIIVFR